MTFLYSNQQPYELISNTKMQICLPRVFDTTIAAVCLQSPEQENAVEDGNPSSLHMEQILGSSG